MHKNIWKNLNMLFLLNLVQMFMISKKCIIFASVFNHPSLAKGLFIKKSGENRLIDALATSAIQAERC